MPSEWLKEEHQKRGGWLLVHRKMKSNPLSGHRVVNYCYSELSCHLAPLSKTKRTKLNNFCSFVNSVMVNSMRNFHGFVFHWEKDMIPIIFTNVWLVTGKIQQLIFHAAFEIRATPPSLPGNLSEKWFFSCL